MTNQEQYDMICNNTIKGRCKDCKFFTREMSLNVCGMTLFVHEMCKRWGYGCKTRENGYCFLFVQKEREGED